MITGKHRSTRSKPCPTDIFSTTKPLWTDLGLSQGLHNDRPPPNRIRGKAFSLTVTVVSCIPNHTVTNVYVHQLMHLFISPREH